MELQNTNVLAKQFETTKTLLIGWENQYRKAMNFL